jgi:hypothetical protein
MTVTKLRENLFKILDKIIKTGIPVEIERYGKKLKIVTVNPPSKLDSLQSPQSGNRDLSGHPRACMAL